ncbi:MAG: hypothetical protein FWF20_05120 [Betaproteobacteria bacterium]|nr:hypothetical protein [Betaproteobacteria bacterium]MCL2886153.1 hypothetical protein [Betaproteobacteria bacterium]
MILKTAVGRAQAGRHRVGWQGATTLQAHACKEEQRRQRARGRPDRARSVLTQMVTLSKVRKDNIHTALIKVTSGQLRFSG